MAWTKKDREILPRHSCGVDWGTDRDVMIRKGGVCVCKTKGHTGWSGVGCSSYYGPKWMLATSESYNGHKDLNRGYGDPGEGRVTNAMWIEWLPKIAEAMGLRVEDMPQKLPRGGTLVWVNAKEGA